MTSTVPVRPVDEPEALEELRRFLLLASELQRPLTMFSEYIDEAWHDLLESPKVYTQFCQEITGGGPISHIPSRNNNPIVRIEWLGEYESRYGPLKPCWFADAEGVVDVLSYEEYRRTGGKPAANREDGRRMREAARGDLPGRALNMRYAALAFDS